MAKSKKKAMEKKAMEYAKILARKAAAAAAANLKRKRKA
jgi:hypothetical protein